MKSKPETVIKYFYCYKNKSRTIIGRKLVRGVPADYRYNYLDVVNLNTGDLAIVIGFHPETDGGYLIEECINRKVKLGGERWVYTEDFINDIVMCPVNVDRNNYLVSKASKEDSKEVLRSFLVELEASSLYDKEVEEIKEVINRLG